MLIHSKNKYALLKKWVYSIISVALFGGAKVVSGQFVRPTRSPDLATFIKDIANVAVQIGGVVAVIFIIWSGFLFVTARGNEEQVKKARTTFYWTIIGTAVLLGAYAISLAVVSFVGTL